MKSKTPNKTVSLGVLVLGLLGTVLSLFSLHSFVGLRSGLLAGPSLCNIGDSMNCDLVNMSEYAQIFGFPLASLGLGFYLSLSCFALVALLVERRMPEGFFADVMLALGFFASLFSIYLFVIAEFVIGSLCIFCIGMYLVNFSLLGVGVWSTKGKNVPARLLGGVRWLAAWPVLSVSGRALGMSLAHDQRTVLRTLAAGLLLLFVFGAVVPERLLFASAGTAPTPGAEPLDWESEATRDMPEAIEEGAFRTYSYGPRDAEVQIVEFFDYECPFCRRMHFEVQDLLGRFEGHVRLTLRNYPLDNSCNPNFREPYHRFACFAAEASRCAGEQGRFWEVHEMFMQSSVFEQKGEVEKAARAEFRKLGLDSAALDECLQSDRQLRPIRDDIRAGDALDIPGTPTFYVNGKLVENPGSLADIIARSLRQPEHE